MRFCPFCAAENPDDVARCVQCYKQLPPARKKVSTPAPPADVVTKPRPKVPRPASPAWAKPVAAPAPPPEVLAAEPQIVLPKAVAPEPASAPKIEPVVDQTLAGPGVAAPLPAAKPAPAPAPKIEPLVDQTLAGPGVAAPLPAPTPMARVEPAPVPNPAPEPQPALAASAPKAERPITLAARPAPVVVNELVISSSGTTRTPAPVEPAAVPTPDDALLAALPPMPPGPAAKTIIASVRYLLPLAKAIWARRRATRSIRSLLYDDQYLIDEVLRDIGRVAHESGLETGAVTESLARVRHEEARQAQATADRATAERNLADEATRWKQEDGVHEQELARLHRALSDDEIELRRCHEEHRAYAAEAARYGAEAAKVTAAKLKQNPANTKPTIEEDTLQAAQQRAVEQAAALDPQIAALTRKIVEWRAALAQAERDHATVKAAHDRINETIGRELARADREANEAAREISQLFVGIGTVLNLQRVPHEQFKPLYDRIDRLRRTVHEREETIVKLASELRTFDRDAAQTGLVTVGLGLGILSLLGIILAVLLAR